MVIADVTGTSTTVTLDKIPSGTYNFKITDKNGESNYSAQFPIQGDVIAASSSSASSETSAKETNTATAAPTSTAASSSAEKSTTLVKSTTAQSTAASNSTTAATSSHSATAKHNTTSAAITTGPASTTTGTYYIFSMRRVCLAQASLQILLTDFVLLQPLAPPLPTLPQNPPLPLSLPEAPLAVFLLPSLSWPALPWPLPSSLNFVDSKVDGGAERVPPKCFILRTKAFFYGTRLNLIS